MARKRKHAEHVNHERWLVSYADFITLLFAFFVVMFAASNADQKKAGKVAQAVQGAFHDLAIFDPTGKVVPLFDEGGVPSNAKAVVGNMHDGFDATQVIPAGGKGGKATATGQAKALEQVKGELQNVLREELKGGTVRISEDGRGLTVSLAEAGFFDPGSALMKPKALEILDRIAAKIRVLPAQIRVEGHTDNTPIHTALFPSNWELSTSRATHVLQYLLANAQIQPMRLSAIGYGEYRPVAENETIEGRAANRRVDLVILGAAAEQLEP
jgi:chemotaxis protein MotB